MAQFEQMAERIIAVSHPGDRELAEQLAQAKDWKRVDDLRMPADRSRVEAVALAWTVNPAAAMRLLSEYRPGCGNPA